MFEPEPSAPPFARGLLLSLAAHGALLAALLLGMGGDEGTVAAGTGGDGVGDAIEIRLLHISDAEPETAAAGEPGDVAGPAPPSDAGVTAGPEAPTDRRLASAPSLPLPARPAAVDLDPPPSAAKSSGPPTRRETRSAASGTSLETADTEASATSPRCGLAADGPLDCAGRTASPSAGRPGWPSSNEVDHAARPIRPIRPAYPPRARARGEESLVVVEAWVDEGGRVAFASIVESGGDPFDSSAERAVRRATFWPARHAGRVLASRVALRVHFQLYN